MLIKACVADYKIGMNTRLRATDVFEARSSNDLQTDKLYTGLVQSNSMQLLISIRV